MSGLGRLEDLLYDREGVLRYEIHGGRDERMRPQIQIAVSGPLHLRCQRCLGVMDYPLHLTNTLLVVVEEGGGGDVDDPDAPDTIEQDPELDVAALIEDEVLLALPFAPRHAEGECDSALQTDAQAARESSPFAGLAALKRASNKP